MLFSYGPYRDADAQKAMLYTPNSVHTVGLQAVILGLAVLSCANLDVCVDQFLCEGCGDRACCLAPVQAKRSLRPESAPDGSRRFLDGPEVSN